MHWVATASLNTETTRRSDGRRLMVSMTFIPTVAPRGAWAMLVLESDKEGAQVLDSHAHAMLPQQTNLDEAMRLAERYARWWRGSRAVPFDCTCGEIESAGASEAAE